MTNEKIKKVIELLSEAQSILSETINEDPSNDTTKKRKNKNTKKGRDKDERDVNAELVSSIDDTLGDILDDLKDKK